MDDEGGDVGSLSATEYHLGVIPVLAEVVAGSDVIGTGTNAGRHVIGVHTSAWGVWSDGAKVADLHGHEPASTPTSPKTPHDEGPASGGAFAFVCPRWEAEVR